MTRNGKRNRALSNANIERLREALDLGGMASVMAPDEAEPPILGPLVRAAVHEWLMELGAEKDLVDVDLKPRKSCLLFGPPGCGKTTLAHHFAARLGLPMVNIYTDTLVSMYVGATQNNIGRLFSALHDYDGDVVLFFDELDAIASERIAGTSSAAKESNANVNALLKRLEEHTGVVIAATNMGQGIDPAIWRRFGLHLDVALPDHDERFAICRRYLLPYDLSDDDFDVLAEVTHGASPALIRQLMEGIKRHLVINPRLNRTNDREFVIPAVVTAVRPHDSYAGIPLWKSSDPASLLEEMSWPPQKIEKAA